MEPEAKKRKIETESDAIPATETQVSNYNDKASSKDLYLDTINRSMLDFDFEKLCSVSLSNLNVYGCLVCGKYFQGRGKASHAYFHSIHEDHHVFINLHTLKVYCLPDGYEVIDSSLDDIKYVLHPTFTKQQVIQLDKNLEYSYDLNSRKYLPGFVGLNNVKANDYINVVIQALVHIPPLRDFFILNNFDSSSELVRRFGLLTRKIWNPKAFKGQVSPHELLQEISKSSDKRFKLTEQGDPIDFLSWFLNTLHRDLGGTRKRSSIITKIFQGTVRVETQSILVKEDNDEPLVMDLDREITTAVSPFMFLTLDLPPPPLFQDEVERNIIPQIPLSSLLGKYNGQRAQEVNGSAKRFHLLKLPRYVIFHIKRFTKNNWTLEKNPTIVNFPIRNIDLSELLDKDQTEIETVDGHYDLIANISHEGKPGAGQGTYKVHVRHRGKDQWFQIQDLIVEEIIPQMIFLSESFIQIWERRPISKGKEKEV